MPKDSRELALKIAARREGRVASACRFCGIVRRL